MIKKKWLIIAALIGVVFINLAIYFEGFQQPRVPPSNQLKQSDPAAACNQRTTCKNCLNGTKPSKGGVCYWCANKCVDSSTPAYDPKTCFSGASKCTV